MSQYPRLKQNIIDVIKEAMLKMGFGSNCVSFNYPLSSLCHLTGTSCTVPEMKALLKDFFADEAETFGVTAFTERDGVFTITVSAEGIAHVRSNTDENEFIAVLINAVRNHASFEEVLSLFKRFSDKVIVEKSENEEFDYLIYFEDGIPDDYRYCITLDFDHVTYHRFTKEDYLDFGF